MEKVRIYAMSGGLDTVDHREGESVGDLLERTGVDLPAEGTVRVNAQPVEFDDPVPSGAVVTVVGATKAG